MLRTDLALMSAAQRAYEVTIRLQNYGQRHVHNEPPGHFAKREIDFEVLELTLRVSTADVTQAKRRLEHPFSHKEQVESALVINMISVGLDILRLGLMVMLGQPKTSAEYIQASSRVGRDPNRPGLVVTLLNIHRPRDRSHYERFTAYHQTFYRSVEATSVTPFAPRTLDRALPAVLTALARYTDPQLTALSGAAALATQRPGLDTVLLRLLSARAAGHATLPQAEAALALPSYPVGYGGDGVSAAGSRTLCGSREDDRPDAAGGDRAGADGCVSGAVLRADRRDQRHPPEFSLWHRLDSEARPAGGGRAGRCRASRPPEGLDSTGRAWMGGNTTITAWRARSPPRCGGSQ